MSEDKTQGLPGKPSFEKRVFERFDVMDARLEKLEARSYDTKPIWEQALKAIRDLSKEVVVIRSDLGEVKTRTTVIESAVAGLTADVTNLKTDVGTLKTDVGTLKTDLGTLKTDVGTLKTDVGTLKTDVGTLKSDVGTLKSDVGTLKTDVGTLKTDVGTLKTDVGTLKSDVGTVKTDVGTVKTDVADMKIAFGRMTNEFVDIRRELRENVRHELSLILKFLIEDRQDIRDAEDRIRNLETKLA